MPVELNPRDKTEKLSPEGSERHKFIKELAQKVRDDDDSREVWKNKQAVAHNVRMGLRKRTNRPYPGAFEAPLPTVDKVIRKVKSMYVSVGTLMKKQIVVNLEDGAEQPFTEQEANDSAQRIERALNGLVRKRDFQWAKKLTLFVDYFMENGWSVFKVIEKFFSRQQNRTVSIEDLDQEELRFLKSLPAKELKQELALREGMDLEDDDDAREIDRAFSQFRSGKKVIKFKKKIVFSEPTVIPERGIRIIVPPGTTDVQSAPRVTHEMWMPIQRLKELARTGVYDKKAVNDLDDEGGAVDNSLDETLRALNEGVNREPLNTGLYRIRESQTWYEDQKWVFTWVEEGLSQKDNLRRSMVQPGDVKVLQEIKFPYEHGMWTYVKHDRELKNTRWHSSRGVPEEIRGLHQMQERMFNARIVRDEINNQPIFRAAPALGFRGNEVRFKPGQVITAEQGQLEQINRPVNVDLSSERIEQQVKAYIEEYEAIPDFTLRNATNQGSSRTLGEIQTAQTLSQRQIGTDVALFLETLSEVAHQMYLILRESVTTPRVIGGVRLTPEDFLVKVQVSWAGSLEATDQQLQMQRAMQRIQVLQAVGLPIGIVTQQNMFNALKDWLDKDPDIEQPERFITAPQEILMQDVEEQQNEIVRMKNGFDTRVEPNDNDAVHLEVIQQYLNDPQNQQALQNPAFANRLQVHANLHIEAENIKTGGSKRTRGGSGRNGQTRTQAPPQVNTQTRRRQAVAQTAAAGS